ncbi:serine/threonine-protein kinase atm [Phtheirospermum japonicum]|uniref:Serine/threonine-protein kinase atm n=1 Tax=Phtheirospermum japonicum TaxID=374723 RepID=A0A830CXD0_9LAMI|nr:serine/threonine-protein kinase atm [Phtheirospermum japonicum]
MVDGAESKTLAENHSNKGVLSEGVRVSDGESNTENVINVESGRLEIGGKRDISKNRAVEVRSRSNRWDSWESWGVMNMVGRVLGGKFSMDDDEVEDVSTSENGSEADVVEDKDAWQGVIGEPMAVSKIEGTGLKGDHQDSVSNELVPAGMLETDKVNDVEVGTFLIPKARGEHQITEKEGEYYVSDLVWGKVKSHPWWPGQIFPSIAASDEAAKHFRKPSYLIAYCGDRSFAWNEGSNIKPFHTHFSQMEKQSNSDGFCHAVSCALDEVTRRVEFGLACPCLSEEVRDKIRTQVVSNAGILEDKNIIDGGDHLSAPASFLPGKLVQFLESVAECPKSITDRLQFTVAKAQLLAFSRWKGHYELPVFEQYIGLLEDDDTQVTLKEEGNDSKNRKATAQDVSSQKRKHPSGEKDCPTTKEKRISALLSSSSLILPNVDEKPVKRAGRRPGPSGSSNPRVKRRKRLLPTSPVEESELVEIIPDEVPTPDVILSRLMLAAKVPMQGFSVLISEVDFLREFRNLICLEKKPSFGNAEMDKGKQPASLETADTSGLGFEGTEDSYWTDRIIQGYSQEQVLFEPENPNDKAVQVGEEAGIKERDTAVENQPTALILNFTNLDSIPDVTNLNEIFGRYGPLMESETEILRKSKRVKVIFKRRADAETAFSSTGKYSIFGPSLVSYRLHYDPTPRKARGKRNKKGTLLKDDA